MENRFDKAPLPKIELSQIVESVEPISTPTKYMIKNPIEDEKAQNPEMSEQRMIPVGKQMDDFPQMVFDD